MWSELMFIKIIGESLIICTGKSCQDLSRYKCMYNNIIRIVKRRESSYQEAECTKLALFSRMTLSPPFLLLLSVVVSA